MSRPKPDDVMVFLRVLERFETPQYEQAYREFLQLAQDCPDYDSLKVRAPQGSAAYADIVDRVLCAYELAAVLIKRGALNEDLFFDIMTPASNIWQKAEAWIRGLQHEFNPHTFANVEWLAARETEWCREQAMQMA